MRSAEVITTVVLMLLGGVVLHDAVRLGFGWGTDGPQSGFFPFWLAVLLLVASLAIFLQAWRRPPRGRFASAEQVRSVLKVLLPVVGFVVLTGGILVGDVRLLPGIGLYVAAGLYLGFYMRWVGRHDWRTITALAVGIPVVTFLVFETWFLVPMPKGPLETWLGY
jgi:hypothetical protein